MNYLIKEYDSNQSFELILNLWNQEYQQIFPITNELLERNLGVDTGFCPQNSYLVFFKEQLIAFILTKASGDQAVIKGVSQTGWISLIYVERHYRKKGIGSKLLKMVIDYFKSLDYQEIFVGKDYKNFFPGIPTDCKPAINWFTNRGFKTHYQTNDMIRDLIANPLELTYKPCKSDLKISYQWVNNDFTGLRKLIEKNWPGRWLLELDDYIQNSGDGFEYLIAINHSNNQEEVIGFCKVGFPSTLTKHIGFSQTWRNRFNALGGVGPLGVDQDFRGLNIAYNMIAYSINTLIKNHADKIIIDWTNLIEFYHQFGFEVWKSYTYISYKIGEKNEKTI